ncbi:Insect intestinal mucin 4 [Operophtera brumata]|uniref:Insect intestinal mucin 4 n=1 Tax=Operophtera brumata TaxID=104452 RepID=A0A0L7K523_OPEBR|nr:Insect intestinal mucin 4 [Operophtera brumata]
MRGISVLLFLIGVAVARGQVNECPTEQETDWTIEQLLRHEDCHKFYKCTFGKPVEYTCPHDLYFNLDLWECDWPHNVDCEGRNDPALTTAAPPEPEPQPQPEPQPPTEEEEVEIDFLSNGCPVDPHIHWLLPHAEDCNLFYYCVWGELVLRECPSALHFNPVIQVCDWPTNAGCAVSANKHADARRRLLNQILA